MCPLASCEAEQAAPCDALVPGSWQCTTHAEAVAQAFGANAPKQPCLCAICAKQAMYLRVLLPTERANRLHHATLCCLGAGNASHTGRSYNCGKMTCISCIIRATILRCDYPVLYVLRFYVVSTTILASILRCDPTFAEICTLARKVTQA